MPPEPLSDFEIYSDVGPLTWALFGIAILILGSLTILAYIIPERRRSIVYLIGVLGFLVPGILILISNRQSYLEFAHISGESRPFETIGRQFIVNQFIGFYFLFTGFCLTATLLPEFRQEH